MSTVVDRVMRHRLVTHEAAHAAAALVLGLDVREVYAPECDHSRAPEDPLAPAGYALIRRPDREDTEALRKMAMSVAVARLEDRSPGWPLRWPLTLAPEPGDTATFCDLVGQLGLDEADYKRLIADMLEVWESAEYDRAHRTICELLQHHDRLDQRALARVKAISEDRHMEHLLLKAATSTGTDAGTFTAVISTATIDRERDIVDPAGMVLALQKWTTTGKRIPLAWNHSTNAEDQIGYIDPASAKALNGEVVVDGWIDQSIEVGQHAWRLVKSGTLGFSFGYLILNSIARPGGGRHITELDVFEVTATTTPMNGDTRVLGWKSIGDPEFDRVRDEWRTQIAGLLGGDPVDPADALREKSARVVREHAPVQIASFDC